MASEHEVTTRQNRSDIQIAVEGYDELQRLSHLFRSQIEQAYGPALKVTLEALLTNADAGVKTLQKYLELFHADDLPAESPEGRLLRPDVPEWRPGSSTSRSSDD